MSDIQLDRLKVSLLDDNGYYIGDYYCHPSPLEPGHYLVPEKSTTVEAHPVEPNTAQHFNGTTFDIVPDFTGQIWYNQTTGLEVTITTRGQPDITLAPTKPMFLLIQEAKVNKNAELIAAYETAITAPVTYTTKGGITDTFNQTEADKNNLNRIIASCTNSKTWRLNGWTNSVGNLITPFTYDDLIGLAEAFEIADVPDFANLIQKLHDLNAANTLVDINTITF